MDKSDKNTLPKVVISILNWMNYSDTIACVQDLLQLDYPNFEILIVDNDSPNDSFEKLTVAFPDLTIIHSKENKGYAAGHLLNYQIAKERQATLFWVLNSDLEVAPDALNELVNAYLKNGNHIYGSVSLNPSQSELIDFGGAPYTINSDKALIYNSWKGKPYQQLKEQISEIYEVESVEGSSIMIPVKIIEEYGFMKTDFFMYAEETDYCYRMRKNGIKSMVVIPSIVKHSNEGSVSGNVVLKAIPVYYRRRNALRLSIEHFKMTKFQALSYPNGSLQNLKALMKGFFSKKKELTYYYALGSFHAFLSIKEKTVSPDKLIK